MTSALLGLKTHQAGCKPCYFPAYSAGLKTKAGDENRETHHQYTIYSSRNTGVHPRTWIYSQAAIRRNRRIWGMCIDHHYHRGGIGVLPVFGVLWAVFRRVRDFDIRIYEGKPLPRGQQVACKRPFVCGDGGLQYRDGKP